MAEHPAIKSQRIDLLFMDTTYAKPTHTHPPQVIFPLHLFYIFTQDWKVFSAKLLPDR